MGSYAWYYHADSRTYYWTESYNMSALHVRYLI